MTSPAPAEFLAYVGTYSVRGSAGVYAVRIDAATGVLHPPAPAAAARSPTFLVIAPRTGTLYASSDGRGMVVCFRVDAASGRLDPIRPTEPAVCKNPCHLSVDREERVVLATNYHAAHVGALPLLSDGSTGAPQVTTHAGASVHPVRQSSAHPHSIHPTPDGQHVLVCDLGQDRIFSYRLDPATATLTPSEPPFTVTRAGCGPRHLAWSSDGRRAHVINELDSTIDTYDLEPASGSLALRQTVSTLPPGHAAPSTAAEIRVHPSGRFVYGSNRGHDSLAVFSVRPDNGLLEPVEIVPCGGAAPRHFTVTPDGRWLVCAHQDSDSLCSFGIDAASGRLTRVPGSVAVPSPVCVIIRP